MATELQWLSSTGLCNDFNTYGHAMPFGRVKQMCIINGCVNESGPIFVFAQSQSVPISRGSPPIP